MTLAVTVLATLGGTNAATAQGTTALRSGCRGPAGSIAIADNLLRNRYTLGVHRTVTLPGDPSWAENPLGDVNWLFNYHSLRFVLALTTAWSETGDRRYLDRASFLLSDWAHDNPRMGAPSTWAWNDHATAWRAVVYACAAEVLPRTTWLSDALVLHGTTLADPAFYRTDGGNHALNQDLGLLEIGCFLGRRDWMTTASGRLGSLVSRSVDTSGVTNEQSVYYEQYNYERYRYAETRLAECGQPVAAAFERVDLMPTFLAHATLPDGTYVPLGDTQTGHLAARIDGTVAEYAATGGASGPKPASTSRAYGAGFAFVRTGWGEVRPFADETMMSVGFGPPHLMRGPGSHGHDDGSAITLYAYGKSIIVDGGLYSYSPGAYRWWFVGRSAHNVVTVDGLQPAPASTWVRWKRSSATLFELMMTGHPYSGITADRRVTFSRSLGYAIVDDQLASASSRTFRQLWHLREGTAPVVTGSRAWTTAPRSNVMVVQVIAPTATRIVKGATSPIQGWVSYKYGTKVAAPVVESRRAGKTGRFLTLLVPFATTRPWVTVTNVSLRPTGYSLTVTINGRSERVVAGSTLSRITPISLPPAR